MTRLGIDSFLKTKQKIGIIPFGHWVGVGNHHENGDELRRRETRAGPAVRE